MTPTSSTTFADVLAHRLRSDPGQPLVTFYDHASGERTELSVTTWANWVAKAGSLLVDELGLERGDRLRIDLPPHWLGTVFLGAAWSAGLVVTTTAAAGRDAAAAGRDAAAVCGPDGLAEWAALADETIVLASALKPMGVRFSDPLPEGVHDIGVEIWSQPDAFVPWDPPGSDDVAMDLDGVEVTQSGLWTAVAADSPFAGGRLLSLANPVTEPTSFVEPLVSGGSLVLVTRVVPDRLEATAVAEQVTARFPPG